MLNFMAGCGILLQGVEFGGRLLIVADCGIGGRLYYFVPRWEILWLGFVFGGRVRPCMHKN